MIIPVYGTIADKHQESSGVRCNRACMDRGSGLHDIDGYSEHGRHQRVVRTVGCLRQLRGREDNHFVDFSHHVPTAATVRHHLLLENRLRAETQGNSQG